VLDMASRGSTLDDLWVVPWVASGKLAAVSADGAEPQAGWML